MLANSSSSNSNPQLKQPSTTIYIEFCHNCDSHLFTVRHQEHKYVQHFEHTKKYLEDKGIIVKRKQAPEQLYKKSPYCPLNVYYRDNGDIVYFPEIGSFEVYLAQTKIFSKLQTNKWPAPEHIYSIVKKKQAQQNKDRYAQLSSTEHVSPKEKPQQKTIGQQASKSYHLKWPRLQSDRYSLERRNLLNRSLNKQNKTARIGAYSFRKKAQAQRKPQTDRIGENYQISKRQMKVVKAELEVPPIVQGKSKSSKANVYLEPIYPKTNVNLQSYQRYRMAYTKKIHEEKVAYEIQKARREAEAALQFRQKTSKPKRPRLIINNIKDQIPKQPNILVLPYHQEKKQEVPHQPSSEEPQNTMKNSLELPKQEREQAEWRQYKKLSENQQEVYDNKKESSAPQHSAKKGVNSKATVQNKKAKQAEQNKRERNVQEQQTKQVQGGQTGPAEIDGTKGQKQKQEIKNNKEEQTYQQQFEELPERKQMAQKQVDNNHFILQTEQKEGEQLENNLNKPEVTVPQTNVLETHKQKRQDLLLTPSREQSQSQPSSKKQIKELQELKQQLKQYASSPSPQPAPSPQQQKQSKQQNNLNVQEYPNEYQQEQNNQYAEEQFDKEENLEANAKKSVEKAQS